MAHDELAGLIVAPDNHRVLFENEDVRVIETTIPGRHPNAGSHASHADGERRRLGIALHPARGLTPAWARNSTPWVSEIRRLEDEWTMALVDRDADRVRGFMTADFSITTAGWLDSPADGETWLRHSLDRSGSTGSSTTTCESGFTAMSSSPRCVATSAARTSRPEASGRWCSGTLTSGCGPPQAGVSTSGRRPADRGLRQKMVVNMPLTDRTEMLLPAVDAPARLSTRTPSTPPRQRDRGPWRPRANVA